MKVGGAKIWRPVRIGGHPEGQPLKPTSADRFEQGMIAVGGRLFIEEYRDLQVCSYPLSQALGKMDAWLRRAPE
jgi:hypothetical protein